MDAEPSADKAARSKRRSRSRSTLSRRSTEDSSNADSNGSSAEKEVPSKDSELHNGAVGEIDDASRENAAKTATEVSSVSAKGEEKQGEKGPRVGDKWKLHLDLSDSCSLSENDASDFDGTTAPSATNPADEGHLEEPETKSSVLKSDDRRVSESVADDSSVLSDTSEFHGFEDTSYDQEYIDTLIGTIQKCETTDDDCCLSSDEIPSSPRTEPEYDPGRTYFHDDDSNSSSMFGHYDSGKDVLSPTVPSSKGKQKVKYPGSPVPSTSRGGSSKKLNVDLSNPAFRKPLDMGWKREIVFRSAGDTSTKRLADVYYFTPMGKKVRSTREVMENLEGTDLTLDNFTFCKEPLGINDPEKEIIRDARRISVTPKDSGSPSTPTGSSVKRIQKLKASAGEMSPVSDQSSASGPSIVKQEPMYVEEETDGMSESSSSGSVSRDQAAAAAEPLTPVEQKIPPAIAGPSGLNKHAGRSQSHLKLARSFPRIKVTSPRSGRGRGQTSPRGGGMSRGAASQMGSSGGNMEIGMLPPMWKDKDGAFTTKVLSSPGAAPALQTTPSRGLGRLPRGGKAGGAVVVPPKVCTVSAEVMAPTAVTVTAGETVLGAAKKYGVCTIQCPGLLGTVPSLQCQLCLCLYHSECVGLGSVNTTMRNFICKNCQLEKDKKPTPGTTTVVTAAPPPLTPISSLEAPKSSQSNSVNTSTVRVSQPGGVPPPLRRLPRPDNKTTFTPIAPATAAPVPVCTSVSTNSTGTMTSAVPTSSASTSAKFVIVPTLMETEEPSARPGVPPPLARLPRQDGKVAPVGVATPNVAPLTLCSSIPTCTTGTASFVAATSSQSPSPKLLVMPTYVKLDQADRATQTLSNAVTTVSIVGSVTTWLPPSSQIRVSGPGGYLRPPLPAVSPAATTLTGCPPPPPPVSQGLMRAGGRRYIVLPKHNVLSVSPAGATLTTRPAGPDTVTAFSAPRAMAPLCNIGSQLPPATQTAYLIGGQNPPGVLLVPVLGSPGTGVPGVQASLPMNRDKQQQQQQQILLVNGSPAGSPGGFVLSATAATGMDAAAESRKRKAAASPPEEAAGVVKKPRVDATNGDTEPLRAFMSRYMANVCETYNAMLHVFEYLKVQELLRASRVCRLWCSIATHESLWQTVRLKNSPVADWKGCVATLAKRGTRHLDMRKMLVPAGRAEEWWAAFCANIGRVPCLESVELCRCPAAVVERVAQQCPQLTTLSALSIKDQAINLSSIGQLKNLQELRLRNLSGLYLNGNMDGLKELTNLKHLSMTMVKNLGHAGCGVLGSLQTLETLELGECCDLPPSFGTETLSQLHSLTRLRLEKGQGEGCPTFALLAGVRMLPALVTLELVNFDVKPGFDTALARCQNVRRLLIIPTYISQSATTNHMVLGGVTKLGNSLTHFVWGVTHELLRVTELFVDQCEDQKGPPGSHVGKDKEKKKSYTPPLPGVGAGDSIPVLRPVPGGIPSEDGENKSADSGTQGEGSSPTSNSPSAPGAPQVDILPLTKLQKMLTTALPNTKIKILKVAFQATWRQYISETDF